MFASLWYVAATSEQSPKTLFRILIDLEGNSKVGGVRFN